MRLGDKAVRALGVVTRRLAQSGSPRLRLLGEKVAWRARRGPQRVTARLDGLHLSLDLRDNLQRELFFQGTYEQALHEVLLAEARPGDVVVDVGANIGVHALSLARRVGPTGEVVAFEAAPDTATVLSEAARRNGIALTVERVALGARTGRLELRSSDRWSDADVGARSLFGAGPVVAEVPMITLDDWFASSGRERIDIVKIDVEGAELDVLRGMTKTLCSRRPRLLVIEVVRVLLEDAGTSPEELDAFLTDVGYRATGPGVLEVAAGNTGGLWPNVVLRPV